MNFRAIITFEDGSAVRLDENTTIAFDGRDEKIALNMNHGFVYNKVAKNDKREYFVVTGDYTVMALGTEFSVENENGDINVIVVESVVEIKDKNDKSLEKIEGGNKATVKSGKIERIKIEDVDLENEFVAWNIAKSNNVKVSM